MRWERAVVGSFSVAVFDPIGAVIVAVGVLGPVVVIVAHYLHNHNTKNNKHFVTMIYILLVLNINSL